MERIELTNEDFSKIIGLMEEIDETSIELTVNELLMTVSLNGETPETELYIKSQYNGELVISRIFLKNRGKGLGTKIFRQLKSLALSKGFKKIIVIQTYTKEINRLCMKEGYVPVEHMGFYHDGEFLGNYELIL
ncbi:GNAT family N-acetyltransferase [Bacillus cereus]|uniref:GNAT family N-acetyltransferase n=1 Tax=Bacillus cereus TaxID=1396 RepID=UPI000B4B9EBA|nr:GNAT family N-acetyltransferase [Bacillus cereus]